MAHELKLRADGRAEMAFVGETPWHGLGQSVTKGASIGVWAKEAGMDWKAQEARVYFEHDASPAGPTASEAEGYKMLYRSDTKQQLGIVGEGYNVVQPGDVLEFFRDMTENDGWWIHTAGVLRGGRKVWAMATNGEAATLGKGDVVKRNMLLATSLDGSMKTIAMETTVRVVCANTLALALRDEKGGKYMATSHRSAFDADLVKKALGINRDLFKRFMNQAQELADTPVNLSQARDILRELFQPEEKTKVTSPKLAWLGDLSKLDIEPEKADNRSVTRSLELFQGEGMGAGLKTAKGTAWGLLNAITQHVDHDLGRAQDTRLDSAWFGRGAGTKKQALELVGAL